MFNDFALDDPRVYAHWVHIHLKGKPYGVVKDLPYELYGQARHVAVMVSEHEITIFRWKRKNLNFADIDINHIHAALRIRDHFVTVEDISAMGFTPDAAEEIYGLWVWSYTHSNIPVLKYDVWN